MSKITEIMIPVKYKARKDATVGEVIKQLTDEHIGWIPVVDENNILLAYITDGDIIRFISHERPKFFEFGEFITIDVDDESIESKVKNLLNTPVMEIARKKHKVSATVEQDIMEVADMFRQEQMHLIAVLDEGSVVGVVREADIVRYILMTFLPEI